MTAGTPSDPRPRARSPQRGLPLLLPALLLLVPGQAAGGTLVLTPGRSGVDLGPAAELLVDESGRLGLHDVRSPARAREFHPIGATQVSLGTSRRAFWLRVCLAGTLEPPRPADEAAPAGEPLVLELGPSGSIAAELYLGPPGSCGRAEVTGWRAQRVTAWHATKPGHAVRRHPRVALPASYPAPTQLYLRVEGQAYLLLAPRLQTIEAHLVSRGTVATWFGAYYGVALAILAINLLIFLSLRDSRYLWYVAFQGLSLAFFYQVEEGVPWLIGAVADPAGGYTLRSFTWGFVQQAGMACLATQFSRKFLDTARHAPRLDRLLRGYMAATLAVLGLGLGFDPAVQDRLIDLVGLSGLVVFLPTLTLVRRRPLPNAIFVLAWSCLVGGIALNVATQLNWIPFTLAGFHSYQLGSALEGVLMTFALAGRIQALRQERDHRVEQLEQANASLSRSSHELRALGLQLAVTEERERRNLAQELHDHTGQTLAAAWIKLQTLQGVELSAEERRLVEECRALLGGVLEQVRRMSFELSSPFLFSQGLVPALRDLAGSVLGPAGLRYDFNVVDEGAARPAELDIVLYQLTRELLRNVVKHARASVVEIVLLADPEQVSLMVTDDGVGFDADRTLAGHAGHGHFGLFGLRERVDYLGGRVEIDSSPGQGCGVALHVPLRRAAGPGERRTPSQTTGAPGANGTERWAEGPALAGR